LCYVGMTRAKDELYMMYATSRMLYGGLQHNAPSRFLSEINAESINSSSDLSSGFNLTSPPADELADIDNNEPRYVPDLEEGDKVRHQIFGHGTVMEIDGETAAVYFKGKGVKKLNIAFAPLEKL